LEIELSDSFGIAYCKTKQLKRK